MGNIHNLQRRGVRIRSLADSEQFCAQYLDAAPDSPESFLAILWRSLLGVPRFAGVVLGYTLAGFAAWVSDQELVSIRRRTKAGAGCPSWRGGHRRLQVEWRTSFGKIEAFWGSRPPRGCRHIHRHSRESRNPKAIGSKCVFASYRILTDSGFPLSPE